MSTIDRNRTAEDNGAQPDEIQWAEARLEAFIHGELTPREQQQIAALIRKDAVLAEQVRLARMIRQGLAELHTPPCPPDIELAVLATARLEAARRSSVPAPESRLNRAGGLVASIGQMWALFLRPALAVATFAALIVAAALIGRSESSPSIAEATNHTERLETGRHAASDADFSVHEVERALQETRWAIAYLSDIGKEAGLSIRRDVLQDRIAQPIRRALDSARVDEPTS